jgi:pimeloyl-ACP methyl ester carboxylesterase
LGFSFPNGDYDYSFHHGSTLLLQVLDCLKVRKVSLLFSCSNGYYAIQAAMVNPDRFHHLFLSQTPSIDSMMKWQEASIPDMLKVPVVGQFMNLMLAQKFVDVWYRYSLPKNHELKHEYSQIAGNSLKKGGCFCLSSLVQGLNKDRKSELSLSGVPTTLVWGSKDFTHRKTDQYSIKKHIQSCEIIEFDGCGHFPELENRKRYVKLIKERTQHQPA